MRLRVQAATTLVIVAGATISSTATADDPVVHVVAQDTTHVAFDAPLPASTYFKLQFKVDPTQTAGRVTVWPRLEATESCGLTRIADVSSRNQFHQIAMAPTGTDANAVLEARIPPLQVGQAFCVSIETFVTVNGAALTTLASNVAEDVRRGVAGGMTVDAALKDGVQRRFKALLGKDLKNADGAVQKINELLPLNAAVNYSTALATQKAHADDLVRLQKDLVALLGVPTPTPAQAAQLTADKAALDQAAGIKSADDKAVADATSALTTGVQQAFSSPLLKPLLVVDDTVAVNGMAGDGTTPAAANYAAIDTGVVAAFPFAYAGGNGTPWVLPYVGLNLYFTPVDRTVALSELVHPVVQRLSLTLGRVLANPTLPNRTITDFGFGYPLLAVGVRVSQFIRATAGAVFYRINADNPTSAGTTFGVAPFIGMSLDGDVIAIAQGNLIPPK